MSTEAPIRDSRDNRLPSAPTYDASSKVNQVQIDWDSKQLRRSPHPYANKFARVIWHLAYLLVFRPSPRVCHWWRRWILRAFGAKVGRQVRTHPNIKIWAPWNLELHDFSCIGDAVDCYSVGKLVVGKYVTVSQYSILCTATHDYSYLHCPLVVGEIILEPFVWICAQAFVMPNVSVGEGTVVGARAVVTKNLPAWKVAAGTPCQVIGPRIVKTEEGRGIRFGDGNSGA
jgi:putative colanic acid biosynthesis acetyltransferase WcaF